MTTFRARDDVPDELVERHPGSTWLLWPDHRKGPWLLRVQWTRVQGRIECCGLEIRSFRESGEEWPPKLPRWDEDPPVLAATTLRQIPLGAILTAFREKAWEGTQKFAALIKGDDVGDDIAAALLREAAVDRAPRRRGVPPLTEVAAVYTAAQQRRRPPTEAVRQHWLVAHSTAAKWVMRARSEGLLPRANRKESR